MHMQEKVWDCHVHLFPDRLFQAIWGWFARFGWDVPYARLPLAYYLYYLQDLGVHKAFLLPYCHKSGMAMDLNGWVCSVCREHSWLIPFAGIHPQDEDVGHILSTCLDSWRFAGVKQQLAVIKYPADHPDLYPIYEHVHKRGKILVIHAGTAPYEPGQAEFAALGLGRLQPVLRDFPGLRVVVPHFGLDELELAQEILACYPQVYVDTSWALANPKLKVSEEELSRFMDSFENQILFGTDFPILEHSPRDMLEAMQRLVPDPEARQKILWENARELVAGSQ